MPNSVDRMDPGDPRVAMAAERTLLAWVRTGLALMGFGFVVARFGVFLQELAALQGLPVPERRGLSVWMGIALVALGVWMLLAAAARYWRYRRALMAGAGAEPPGPGFGLAVALILALLGLVMAGYLLALA